MNYALAKEIYGRSPWFMDAKSLPGLLGVLKNANSLEVPDVKYNTPGILDVSGKTKFITSTFQLKTMEDEDFEGIGLINLNGPITLSGGLSSIGMEELSEMMLTMNADDRIKSFLIRVDSGGGSSAAVEIMVDTINEIRKEKPINATIKKGGGAHSAAYGIISACNKITSESLMNGVGSCGTMIQFAGIEANTGEKDVDNIKTVRVYASKSTEKNREFEEAINNNNFKPLIDNLLDPVNENFLQMIESNRPQLKGTDFDNGHDVFARDAIGTFIDGIENFNQCVENLVAESLLNIDVEISNNNKIKNMDIDTLKQKHPDIYNSIFKAGVHAERDRVGSWLAHLATDQESVIKGIESGEAITSTQTQEFLVKQVSGNLLNNLQEQNAPDIVTESSGEKDPSEEDAFYAAIDKKLNLKIH